MRAIDWCLNSLSYLFVLGVGAFCRHPGLPGRLRVRHLAEALPVGPGRDQAECQAPPHRRTG